MSRQLESYEILLGVSGGIAAYKSAFLCSQLVRQGAGVTCAMTPAAQRFVGPLTFGTLTGRKVYTDLFDLPADHDARHIALTERADLIVVAPATANVLAKMAAGICDNLLCTLLCSAQSPILLAPAMNVHMWEHPATRRNVQQLQQWSCQFVGPAAGRLACGDEGVGRMAEPEEIVARIVALVAAQPPKSSKNTP
ncbi:MAG: phosphopantothenoylcysteine decarboxylase [Sedimentisphaerales bacterium]|nr:phosphopantothenoylcysteine decarboxylase [Sedimentisphaerales bacterium]